MSEEDDWLNESLLDCVLEGRYRLEEIIGAGGMGVVYRAKQIGALERDVAVKVLSVVHSLNTTVIRRFESEARIVADLRHPNIIRLYDTGRLPDGRLYLVTELLHGETLEAHLRRGRIAAKRALRIISNICDALEEAHGKGVIHRDLKPANVFLEMVADQEIVRVLDFGIARAAHSPALTAPMHIVGTPGFMAPEQCSGGTVDVRADLFALGALLYACVGLRPPFSCVGDSALEVMLATIGPPPPPLPEDVPADVSALAFWLLRKDPKDRPQSVREVRDRIAEVQFILQKEPMPWGWANEKSTDRSQSNGKVTAYSSAEMLVSRDILRTSESTDRGPVVALSDSVEVDHELEALLIQRDSDEVIYGTEMCSVERYAAFGSETSSSRSYRAFGEEATVDQSAVTRAAPRPDSVIPTPRVVSTPRLPLLLVKGRPDSLPPRPPRGASRVRRSAGRRFIDRWLSVVTVALALVLAAAALYTVASSRSAPPSQSASGEREEARTGPGP